MALSLYPYLQAVVDSQPSHCPRKGGLHPKNATVRCGMWARVINNLFFFFSKNTVHNLSKTLKLRKKNRRNKIYKVPQTVKKLPVSSFQREDQEHAESNNYHRSQRSLPC